MNSKAVLIATAVGLLTVSQVYAATTIWIDNLSGKVTQQDDSVMGSPAQIAGSRACVLDTTGANNLAFVAQPNGGVTTQATPDAQGNCNGATFTALPTPTATTAPVPVFVATAALGTSPTISLIAGSNAQRGVLRLVAGTFPSAGILINVTYPRTFNSTPLVMIQPENAVTAALCQCYATGESPTGTAIAVAGVPVAGTAYLLKYVLVP